ncbi:MAG: DUF1844 domain-containing protein [Acidobacteria bacterium]|nr:DUF1844 domain-containing protein [Acidobacteriota bacterium]
MSEEKPEASEFKVVDRRGFHADGTPRDPSPAAGPASASSPTAAPDLSPPPSFAAQREVQGEVQGEESGEGVNFGDLVMSLSTTAMFQLGLLESPEGEKVPADLPNARRTIDMLGVLKGKTQGNLAEDEEKLLTQILYELQMSFVAVTDQPKK